MALPAEAQKHQPELLSFQLPLFSYGFTGKKQQEKFYNSVLDEMQIAWEKGKRIKPDQWLSPFVPSLSHHSPATRKCAEHFQYAGTEGKLPQKDQGKTSLWSRVRRSTEQLYQTSMAGVPTTEPGEVPPQARSRRNQTLSRFDKKADMNRVEEGCSAAAGDGLSCEQLGHTGSHGVKKRPSQ